ncbi:hypothetical protein Tco_1491116, partial [Tanacetum coccineum]
MESGSYWLDKVWTSIWRDVRTLAIEEAYTTKYSIHPGADTMLCGFRLTNRWLSMKKDIASCGSKYLAYSEVEVEYKGSSGLLLQPELPEGHELKHNMIVLAKVRGYSKRGPEFTWERKDQMRSKCPQLFVDSANASSSKILGADQLLVILCYRYQESGIGYWIFSMTISGSGVNVPTSMCMVFFGGYGDSDVHAS